MASISDFNKYKPLTVASVSGTPTISKAVPVKITSGESTTGTGEIGIDWTNVSSQADIGIYDESDTLMDYYFESFDAIAETAIVWVYDSWARDGTEQLRVAYGNGPSDQSVVASTVFDKKANLQAGYLFNESSGDLLDVTSNNNDGTVDGATQGATGIVDGAYSFDGTDDNVSWSYDLIRTDSGSWSLSLWFNFVTTSHRHIFFAQYVDYCEAHTDGTVSIYLANGTRLRGGSWSTNTYHHVVYVYDTANDEAYLYLDGTVVASVIGGIDSTVRSSDCILGAFNNNQYNSEGIIDEVRILDTALTSNEISADYAATKSSPDFFSQQSAITVGQSATTVGNAIFFGTNF